MPKLSPAEVAYLVQIHWGAAPDSRGQPEDVTAIAIAMCESEGVTNAVGDGDGNEINGDPTTGDSHGLFQIHWPTWQNTLPQVQTQTDLYDPNVNVRAAHFIWQQAGLAFTDWTCYNSGGYLRHLSAAREAAANPEKPSDVTVQGQDAPNPDPIQDIASAIGQIQSFVGFLTDSRNWLRAGMFLGGAILILIGIVAFLGPRAARAVPAGKIVRRLAR